METFNLKRYLDFWATKTENWLRDNISHNNKYSVGLIESMRYSLLAGGKRLRPALIYSSFGIFDSFFDKVTPFAAAVEMLHTYSLIHDDLPAMDDDDLRRGKPTNHKMFNEATAILAGDALLTKAFEVMLNDKVQEDIDHDLMVEAAFKLSIAAGDSGMVAGQFADMRAEGGNFDAESVEYIHMNKTSALIAYSTELGAILGYGNADDKANMKQFGNKIGQAFQIADDIMDLTSTTAEMGKDAGSDVENGKATYPAAYGIDKSQKIADDLIQEAVAILEPYGKATRPLKEIAYFITNRKN